MEKETKYEDIAHKERRIRLGIANRGRLSGDAIYYFILHNFISALIFFTVFYFVVPSENFFDFVTGVIILTLISGIIARIFAFYLIRLIVRRVLKKEMKKFNELYKGINKITFPYLIAVVISSVCFVLGILTLFQYLIFREKSFMALILSYMILKIGIFLIVRTMYGMSILRGK